MRQRPSVGVARQSLLVIHPDRSLTTTSALAINIIDMVGVGPFVTLPLIVITMGGPQAALGWISGAALSMCDGLVWSELGATYPEAGGSYAYLKRLYGEQGAGRPLSFLYAWQLLFSAPLSVASGCIGFSLYVSFFLPASVTARTLSLSLFHVPIVCGVRTALAMAICLAATLLLRLDMQLLGRLVKALGLAVIAALVWIIVVGFTHFHPDLAFSFPVDAFKINGPFIAGLGSGMLISAYDYGATTTSVLWVRKYAIPPEPFPARSSAPLRSSQRFIC